MPQIEPACPVCDADLQLNGDERPGEEITCGYCGSPCRLVKKAEDEVFSAEEDF
jgi:hypothetical protein